jgi:hypothetical protein
LGFRLLLRKRGEGKLGTAAVFLAC